MWGWITAVLEGLGGIFVRILGMFEPEKKKVNTNETDKTPKPKRDAVLNSLGVSDSKKGD